MFSKLSVVVASVLVTLAAATPMAHSTPPATTPQDSLQCNSVVPASSTVAALGIDLTGLNVIRKTRNSWIVLYTLYSAAYCCIHVIAGHSYISAMVFLMVPIGLSCSLITVAGNNCGSTTVTCATSEKQWGGLIAINCIPITL
ncbi:hypothetical protein C8J57DRAFT_1467901 [Mycena rebaudengoi]|nr:hypothetical protein C8J57DRAFT_1471711 [Mycena rebaudengoi]KAJ7271454.1 hypothetical protein C8J57DRAFT_1467901 [Mycena rebaudengoi]